jgi:triosephosphate isomerase
MGETNDIIHDQLIGGLSNITGEEVSKLVIAYEPIWAIGTGNNATPADVEKAVKAIRSQIRHLFGAEPAKKVRVLYGGSVTADNATSYMSTPGVDGLLVGGASLNVHTFAEIVNQAHALTAKGKK